VRLRIEIDRDTCIGSGNCAHLAPATFDLDDDLIAIVVDPAGDPPERIELAADGCPTKSITLHRDDA
jgi:ferredoxin